MQTLATNLNIVNAAPAESDGWFNSADPTTRADRLKAVYRQLFKENRDLDFFHNFALDSAYLKGNLTTRQLVMSLLSSEMYQDYILSVNSNYHFVALCFERVLGRPATDAEVRGWSSLLATEGLNHFAKQLVDSDEYLAAFGEDDVPTRRSQKLSPSLQGIPALPESASRKRYDGPGRTNPKLLWYGSSQSLLPWEGGQPPKLVRQVATVLAIAGGIEVARLFLTFVTNALGVG